MKLMIYLALKIENRGSLAHLTMKLSQKYQQFLFSFVNLPKKSGSILIRLRFPE